MITHLHRLSAGVQCDRRACTPVHTGLLYPSKRYFYTHMICASVPVRLQPTQEICCFCVHMAVDADKLAGKNTG